MKKICRYCGRGRTVQPYRDSSRLIVGCPLKALIKFQIRLLEQRSLLKKAKELALKNCPRGGTGRR